VLGVADPAPVHLMGGTNISNAGRRYRRARRLRSNPRGVVAVIGTLLALLVFFALFGIFLTQYVPLWMTDNESQFTAQAATSFADFKEAVDSQYILNGPQSVGTAFTISSQGIPLLAQPTEGTLAFLPTTCPGGFYTRANAPSAVYYGQPVTPSYCVFENITFNLGPGATATSANYYSQHVPSGALEMVLPNRYYNAQTFYFEDDALIQSQGGPQQIVVLPPPLNVTTVGGNTTVVTSFLQLYGNASTVIGQGSEQVFSHLRYTQTVSSNGKPLNGGLSLLNVTFEIGTQYPCAWQKQLRSIMNVSGLPQNNGPPTGAYAYPASYYNWTNPITHGTQTIPLATSTCTFTTGQTTLLALQLTDVDYATVFYAGVQLALGVGGT
jgi:hypothetical protein